MASMIGRDAILGLRPPTAELVVQTIAVLGFAVLFAYTHDAGHWTGLDVGLAAAGSMLLKSLIMDAQLRRKIDALVHETAS